MLFNDKIRINAARIFMIIRLRLQAKINVKIQLAHLICRTGRMNDDGDGVKSIVSALYHRGELFNNNRMTTLACKAAAIITFGAIGGLVSDTLLSKSPTMVKFPICSIRI